MPITNDDLHVRLKRIVAIQSIVILMLFFLCGGSMFLAVNMGGMQARGKHNVEALDDLKNMVSAQCGPRSDGPTIVVPPQVTPQRIH